ncbi:Uu.00g049320.m01.CDS01, partial [Anthostomella pinea]
MTSEAQPGKHSSRGITLIDAEAEGQYDEPAETTPLIGAGAAEQEGQGDVAANDGNGNGNGNGKRTHAWEGSEGFEDIVWWRRPSVYWLLPPYFLFTLAFGGILVPKINLIVDLVCRQYFSEQQALDSAFTFSPVIIGGNNPQCNASASVQKSVATFTLIIGALTGGLSAITAPKLGSLSDRYGRTRLMVIASCGGVLAEVITILAAKFPDSVDFHWIILGAFFDGVTGSFTAGSVLANAYTSDCTPPSKRGVFVGYLHACLFTGLAFGPLVASYFVKWTGSLLVIFYVVLGCHIFVILFFWFVLPESMSKKRQEIAREKHRADMQAVDGSLPESVTRIVGPRLSSLMVDNLGTWLPFIFSANPFAPLKILWPHGAHNRALRRNLILFAIVDTIIMGTAIGSGTVTVLYSEFMFGWETPEAARFVSIVSLSRVVILLGFFPLVNYIFRIRPLRRKRELSGSLHDVETNSGADNLDVWLLRFALVSDLAGIIGYIFARKEELFVVSGIITAFGGLAGATIQSSVTKHVPAERVGSLLGAMGLLHALGRVFAPILFNGIYAATIETYPQAFFVVLASLFGLAVLASIFVRPHLYMKEEGYIAVPVREPGNPSDIDNMADEEQKVGTRFMTLGPHKNADDSCFVKNQTVPAAGLASPPEQQHHEKPYESHSGSSPEGDREAQRHHAVGPPPASVGDGSEPTATAAAAVEPQEFAETATDFPEGGLQAWLVVAGSFCAMVGVYGIINSAAVFESYFSTHQLQGYSSSTIGWVFSTYLFIVFFAGIQVGPLFDRHGPRLLVAVGSLLVVASQLLLGLCK